MTKKQCQSFVGGTSEEDFCCHFNSLWKYEFLSMQTRMAKVKADGSVASLVPIE